MEHVLVSITLWGKKAYHTVKISNHFFKALLLSVMQVFFYAGDIEFIW